MPVSEIRIAGFGGQGVILSAIIIGKAGCIYQPGYATMTQNFGPEARGGACSAQLILSDTPVLYPYVPRPDILVVMSQEAYGLFAPQLKDEGTLIIEEDLVRIGELPAGVRVYSVPPTRIAEELGKKMVLNIVMVGFFGAITQVVEREARSWPRCCAISRRRFSGPRRSSPAPASPAHPWTSIPRLPPTRTSAAGLVTNSGP